MRRFLADTFIRCGAVLMGGAILTASEAFAWQAGSDGRLCTLDHAQPGVTLRITHDPTLPLYALVLRLDDAWPDAPMFQIAFDGGQALTITTTQHRLSADNHSLEVTDRGFGNVLDGLARNLRAVAAVEGRAVPLDLTGAAEAVAVFRACGQVPTA